MVLGRSFGLRSGHDHEDRFISYTAAVHEAADGSDWSVNFPSHWSRRDADQVTKIRQIEFALYAYGRKHFARATPSLSASASNIASTS